MDAWTCSPSGCLHSSHDLYLFLNHHLGLILDLEFRACLLCASIDPFLMLELPRLFADPCLTSTDDEFTV